MKNLSPVEVQTLITTILMVFIIFGYFIYLEIALSIKPFKGLTKKEFLEKYNITKEVYLNIGFKGQKIRFWALKTLYKLRFKEELPE